MSAQQLDVQIKGSLPSGQPPGGTRNTSPGDTRTTSSPPPPFRLPATPLHPTNPLDTAPSSPQQIYLNLLILEASLRSQYLTLTLRRRKYTFFFLLLLIWTLYFFTTLFILSGPSPYYYISLLQKLCFLAGAVTLGLFYLSGLYKRTLVYPRKFVGNTNKGLRQFNIKLVSVKVGWRERVMGWLVCFPIVAWWCPHAECLPYIPPGELEKGRSLGEVWRSLSLHPPPPPPPQAQNSTAAAAAHIHQMSGTTTPTKKRRLSHAPPVSGLLITPSSSRMPQDGAGGLEEEESYQPSGSHVKLVILPKGFSPDFRAGWEVYRTEYWEKENERRAMLREKARLQGRGSGSGSGSGGGGGGSKSAGKRGRQASNTPPPPPSDGGGADSTTNTTASPQNTPPRTRRSSVSSSLKSRRSVAEEYAGSSNAGTPAPSGLRAEYLADMAEAEVSDAGSVRSVAGSVGGGGGGEWWWRGEGGEKRVEEG
ncbi:Spo7-like protein-domain-containing protein [Peziza echinospora]|nr:Spo7-like protein-domain-containing protein [Peziza echinospora]